MTEKQKEIQSYIVAAILIFAFWADSVHPLLSNNYVRQKEFETGQTWVMDKNGHNINN